MTTAFRPFHPFNAKKKMILLVAKDHGAKYI